MSTFYKIDLFYLIPVALAGVVAAIILLILRRKRNGVRPKHAKLFLFLALGLFAFAFVTVILIPVIHYVILLIEFGAEFVYAAFKSL